MQENRFFNSKARQDEFVLNMLGFKRDGTYVDIGSGDSRDSNNTHCLDALGWRGICVESQEHHAPSYAGRRGRLVLGDARSVDYAAEFRESGLPETIDYLSIDVDNHCLDVLRVIPFGERRFRVITIEHDYYRVGDELRVPQRDILSSHGYFLLCDDVYVEQPDWPCEMCCHEDWWVHPDDFGPELLGAIRSFCEYPSRIIRKFHSMREAAGLASLDIYPGLTWGPLKGTDFEAGFRREFSGGTDYEREFQVSPGDVVVDVGANVGLFTIRAMQAGASRVLSIEPDAEAHQALLHNVSVMSAYHPGTRVDVVHAGVVPPDGQERAGWVHDPSVNRYGQPLPHIDNGASFVEIVRAAGVSTIDFLKVDCEGGEYDVLCPENLDYIAANVRRICCEFHLQSLAQSEGFRRFRDEFLPRFERFEVRAFDGSDIKSWMHEEAFLAYYNMVFVHIDNSRAVMGPEPAFEWGPVQGSPFQGVLQDEFASGRNTYDKHFRVEPGDVVLDLGANIGLFSVSAVRSGASRVLALEPMPEALAALHANLASICSAHPGSSAAVLGRALSSFDGPMHTAGLFDPSTMENGAQLKPATGVTLRSLVESQGLGRIDFLKLDCEGGEYDALNDDTLEFCLANVYKIAGEFHLHDKGLKRKFRRFRDGFLSRFPEFRVESVDGQDIGWWLHEDGFIQNYSRVYVYIDNTRARGSGPVPNLLPGLPSRPEYWRRTSVPTVEFTTTVPKKGCVVDCAYCPQRVLVARYEGRTHLPLDDFKRIVDKLPPEVRITFSGFVEPWMNKHATDMLLYAHEQGHGISVFTTGVGMTPDDVDRIKDVPFLGGPNGGFCLHLPDSEMIARHPMTDNLMRVYERFGELRNHISQFCVMSMSEVHESIRHVFPDAVIPRFWNRAGNLLGEAIIKPELERWMHRVHHTDMIPGEATCNCVEDLYHNVVMPNGDVSLCCQDYGLRHILGNILEQEYEQIIPRPLQCFSLCRTCENGVTPDVRAMAMALSSLKIRDEI